MLPDIVYPVRPGTINEELRYSLRSLANVPHGRVWIAGHRPPWARGVGHIPVPPQATKYLGSTANLRAAVEHPEVAEEFLYFNDDFFVMTAVQEVPALHRGPVDRVEAYGALFVSRKGGGGCRRPVPEDGCCQSSGRSQVGQVKRCACRTPALRSSSATTRSIVRAMCGYTPSLQSIQMRGTAGSTAA